ncbi:SDR family NAD(P)-dependent oxidoreductase [Streptomyces sp. MBT62]|uniref:SDR family NAD(P)-dependent oxidoreductase n=1 Tax=Streptomyces sp. MBT62 TaxID=2800410 RepID=UPI00190B3464|nr:SDR family oxidoreductase [Streptomyces sp. MBT62]MBK3563611.1 SDR family oxidoreductase [Streptomyces sp. MBT62]
MGKLDGKTAVITGGSSGIGLATARTFVAEGADVYITGLDAEEPVKARAGIGGDVTAVQVDISSLEDLDRLWRQVEKERGGVDVIVANAGRGEQSTLAEATPEHFDRLFSVNARGTFFTVQKALPLLNDNGSIVLMASAGHLNGAAERTVYSATKAAIRSFARTWASELKDRGIRVNTVSPGPIDTPVIDTQDDPAALRASLAAMIPLRRLGLPEEIAAAALFLAADDNRYTTGSDLVVDGGHTQL